MTKRLIILIIISFISVVSLFAQEQTATIDTNLLKVNKYISLIIDQTPSVPDSLIKMSDYLIGVSKDSIMKTYVARFLFDKFFNSPIMGMETPAIYLANNYFLNGKLKGFHSEDLAMLNLFVEFNKNSLIGMSAPELKLESISGDSVSLNSIKSKYTLLYFYDDECSVCKAESPKIKAVLSEFINIEISVFAVFVQSSKDNWKVDISKNYSLDSIAGHNWYFMWDPDLKSEYQRLYGVISTPKLFLLDENKKIVGRNLNASSLKKLLQSLSVNEDEQKAKLFYFFTEYFKNFDTKDSSSIDSAIKSLYDKSIQDKDLYTSLFSELYLFFKYSQDNNLKKRAVTLANNYILNRPEIWNEDYIAHITKSRISAQKNPIGRVAQELSLSNLKGRKVVTNKIVADSIILVFFDFNCPVCVKEIKELQKKHSLYKEKGVKIVLIYTGQNFEGLKIFFKENKIEWVTLWDKDRKAKIFEKYDLTEIPAIYLLNSNKVVIAKDINIEQLIKLIQ